MACHDPASIRNIGIIAHIDAGKTTLSERILFYCQKIHRLGEVHDGAATMDFMPEEQERGITITSACTTCQWRDCDINLVDTPGHVDFTMEVERCLRVLDGAVGVFCAVGGVEPQSETVWRQSEDFNIPKLAFINKMDRLGANFANVMEELATRLHANPAPITIPLGEGEDFRGVLDLINEQILLFDAEDQGRTVSAAPFGEAESALAQPWREKLLEKIAEADDEFLELYLEGHFSSRDMIAGLQKAVLGRKLTPVFCGSALRNIGVQPLLDAVCDFLPSPAQAPPALGVTSKGKEEKIFPQCKGEPVGLIFKVVMDGARKNCFMRLYSGQIREGETLCNYRTEKQERIGRLYRLHADRREQLEQLSAGDIASIVGLRDARTGDTYCAKSHLVRLEPIDAYAPVITLALEPRNADEGKILDEALNRYAEEDPTLKISMDEESGIRAISGMGELHLEVVLERLNREYKIAPRAGQPQVVLRETINGEAEARINFDRELGKERHQGEVAISIHSRPRNSGTEISIGSFLPADPMEARKIMSPAYVEAVREGVGDSLQSGPLSGWPMVDLAITIEDIKIQDGVTTVPGLRMAASHAVQEAFLKAAPVHMEPIMQVEITVPEDFLGSALNLFQQLGGKVDDLHDNAGIKHIHGHAPLRQLFGFATKLRSATQGRAGYIMSFDRFDVI